MAMEPPGVPAAPNRSEIKARVLRVEQSSTFPDKWYVDLEILESKSLSGPNFARVGEKAKGFTFGSTFDVSPGSVITAEAEFVGDARGGQFQLSRINVVEQPE
jgi:hypothetical protein